jgi:acyl dehydratase
VNLSPVEFDDPLKLIDAVGTQLGPTAWRTLDQGTVDTFGHLTGDTQWVHCDVARATAGPFGGTIGHGYLTLAFCSTFLSEALRVAGVEMEINYGLDRVRFPSPVRTGSSIRGVATIQSAEQVSWGAGIQAGIRMIIEVRDEEKPACVADLLVRYEADGGKHQ